MASSLKLARRNIDQKSIFDRRIHEIDLVRGLLIILVVCDHVFWNLKHYGAIWYDASSNTNRAFLFFRDFFGWYWTSSARSVIQPIILMAFCFISGVSCAFSRNNWKRAVQTLTIWFLIASISNIAKIFGFFPDQGTVRVDFNIIGVLGFSTLFYCFIQNRSWKSLAAATLIAFVMSWFIIPNIQDNFIRFFGSSPVVHAEHTSYVPNFYFPFFWEPAEVFGGTKQADYVPLFPYIMFFFGGALVTYFVYRKKRKSLFRSFEWERPICFLGRHTFVIYIVHQAVLTGLFTVLNAIIQAYY